MKNVFKANWKIVLALFAAYAGIMAIIDTRAAIPSIIMSLVLYWPGFYVFYQLRKNIAGRSSQIFLFALMAFLTFTFPTGFFLINVFKIFPNSQIIRGAYEIGAYYLPFLLYSFLITLIAHIFYAGAGLFKKNIRQKKWVKNFNIILIFMAIGVTIYGVFNYYNIKPTEYEIEIPGKRSKLDSLKIAVFSDLHLTHNSRGTIISEIRELVNSYNPDLILIPGDIIDTYATLARERGYEGEFKKLKSRYGVFAVTGNHEYYGSLKENIDFIKDAGITLMQDTLVLAGDGIYIAGRNDRTDKERKPLKEILAGKTQNLPVILLDHQPNSVGESIQNKIDIQFSGHTHHGQLFPFNFITEIVYDVSWGLKKIGQTYIAVSSGAGLWGAQARTGSNSEIIFAKVVFTR